MSVDALKSKLLSGNRLALSKAITLVESNLVDHRKDAINLVADICDHQRKTLRIGITGIPGVGKSTFIEQLGLHIINQGHKLSVLAIDPSSSRSAGSILGDKTRMERLSREPNAFIRPSPSGGTLGGVAARTRESMLLCEAAGFDVVILETVGVGQSETEILNIADVFVMLAMPGTGDELQGIKRGIMEAADVIVINKADGANLEAAKRAKKQMEMALHLFPQRDSGWNTRVKLTSALNNEGITECWNEITDFHQHISDSGYLAELRATQQKRAFQRIAEVNILESVMHAMKASGKVGEIESAVSKGEINEYRGASELLKVLDRIMSGYQI